MAEKRLDLRKKAVVPSPAAPSVVPPSGLPQLPISGLPPAPGTILNLSPSERAQLEAMDWKEGEPVPNVADMVEQIKRDAESQLPDPNMPMVAQPREIDITALPPEKQAALKVQMRQMIEDGKRLQALQAEQLENPTSPDVNKAIEQLLAGDGTQYNIVPPTEKPKPAAAPQPAVAPAPTPTAMPTTGMATAADVATLCKNCNHLVDKDPIEVTPEDKHNFLVMMMTGAPFTKTYEMLGGNLRVTFRSLSRAELDMAIQQAGCDTRDGVSASQVDFFRNVQNYEMFLSIRQIRSLSDVTDFPNSIKEVDVDPLEPGQPYQTPLKTYAPHVADSIGSASMFRMVTMLYGRFYAMLRRLEENAFNADFWQGIGTQA